MQQPSATLPWLPDASKLPLYATTTLVRNDRLLFDCIGTPAAAGVYGVIFRGTYVDDNDVEHLVCAERDGFLTLIDEIAANGHPRIDDDELRRFYLQVRIDLAAPWRLLGEQRVVNYLAITTTTRMVANRTVVLPEYFIMEEDGETLATWLEQHPAGAENRAAFKSENNATIARALYDKASTLRKMGGAVNLQAAVARYDRVININAAALGADHTSTAAAMYAKAEALVKMGGAANLQVALALYNRVIEIRTAAWGADHISTDVATYAKTQAMVKVFDAANFQVAMALLRSGWPILRASY
jgi:hypothetical protein